VRLWAAALPFLLLDLDLRFLASFD
jgi:hypothetical protein